MIDVIADTNVYLL